MTSEPRYTLIAAQAELFRRECAEGAHSPDTVIRRGDFVPLRAYCRCGRYRWDPIDTDAAPVDLGVGNDQ